MNITWMRILSLIWIIVMVSCAVLWVENSILLTLVMVIGSTVAALLTCGAIVEILVWIRE